MESESGIRIDMDESTLAEALAFLSSKLGEEFDRLIFDGHSKKIKNSNLILLNGQNYLNLAKRINTPLKDGDEISLLPMVAGG